MRYDITYGKRRVPVYRFAATPLTGVRQILESPCTGRANHLLAAEIDVEVFGDDFLDAYLVGDNRTVVATDSMKNFIIRETLNYEGATLEGLCYFLGAGFARAYPTLRTLELSAVSLPFTPAAVPTGDGAWTASDNLFDQGRGDREQVTVRLEANGADVRIVDHQCARVDIRLMKLTGSSFTAFVRDEYTTLPDRRDRPLYIFLDVKWRYADPHDMLGNDPARFVPSEQVRDLCSVVFAEFVSESIQHLVHEMGSRLLERFPQLTEVGFSAQNRTRDPFGEREDDHAKRVYSDPFSAYGEITLTMHR